MIEPKQMSKRMMTSIGRSTPPRSLKISFESSAAARTLRKQKRFFPAFFSFSSGT